MAKKRATARPRVSKKATSTGKTKKPGSTAPKAGAADRKASAKPKTSETAAVLPSTKEPPAALLRRPGFPIVGIGASAGGLEAFETFFKAMPSDSGMAFVVVAHLDPTHVSILPELIQKRTEMSVVQVADGTRIKPNTVYVIPPNKALEVLNGVLQLLEPSRPRGVSLPIDSFFRSLAQDQGPNAVAIILSGTGTDGTLGLRAIKGETGMVMVQDEESAKYDGMPRSAIGTGLADFVLPVDKMPEQLIKYARHALLAPSPKIPGATEGELPDVLQKIYVLLRSRTGHDFSLYKRNTILRRVERRMSVHQIDDVSDYVRYLQESEHEANILFKELLIGVTSFFRDPEAFDVLKDGVLHQLLGGRPEGHTFRAWVPGCSSGEEAYSLAIILHESMERLKRHFSVQIFGTDLDADAIDVARAGRYPASIADDVGERRLKRYFTEEDDGQYRIAKAIREMLVFAPQNVIKDPPFTKLDLLSCRNLLIYLGGELQKKLLPLFHYSLRPDGVLFLGTSETIGQAADLFSLIDRKWKIFRCKSSASVFASSASSRVSSILSCSASIPSFLSETVCFSFAMFSSRVSILVSMPSPAFFNFVIWSSKLFSLEFVIVICLIFSKISVLSKARAFFFSPHLARLSWAFNIFAISPAAPEPEACFSSFTVLSMLPVSAYFAIAASIA